MVGSRCRLSIGIPSREEGGLAEGDARGWSSRIPGWRHALDANAPHTHTLPNLFQGWVLGSALPLGVQRENVVRAELAGYAGRRRGRARGEDVTIGCRTTALLTHSVSQWRQVQRCVALHFGRPTLALTRSLTGAQPPPRVWSRLTHLLTRRRIWHGVGVAGAHSCPFCARVIQT